MSIEFNESYFLSKYYFLDDFRPDKLINFLDPLFNFSLRQPSTALTRLHNTNLYLINKLKVPKRLSDHLLTLLPILFVKHWKYVFDLKVNSFEQL